MNNLNDKIDEEGIPGVSPGHIAMYRASHFTE